MVGTVTTNAAGGDAIVHDRTACIAAIIADTATASGASAADINLVNGAFSIIVGAARAHAATINLTGTDATAPAPVAHITVNVADTATASDASVVDMVGPGTPMPTDCAADVATS